MTQLVWIGGFELAIGDCLHNYEYNSIVRLLESYIDVFVGQLNMFSVTNEFCGRIRTTKTNPIFIKSNLSYNDNQLLMDAVNELLMSGHLQSSTSQWSSPVRPVHFKGELNISVNYQALNAITIDEGPNLPEIAYLIDAIDSSSCFSKIVIKDGFHQLELDASSKHKTAFATDFGHFEFTTYHYGLKNAQRELQTLIESVLLDETNQNYITIYMGRILVHTQSSEHHFDLLEDIFWRLQNSNLLIDFAESAFLTNRIDYLGYFINSTGVWLTENQANKIAHFNEPCSKRDVRSFLGLTSRYKDYIPNYDFNAARLRELTNPNIDFYWNRVHREAFYYLKERSNLGCLRRF